MILHFLLHSGEPVREAQGSPGITFAMCLFSPSAGAPSLPLMPSPAAPAHASVSVQPLCGYAVQCADVAPAPGAKRNSYTCSDIKLQQFKKKYLGGHFS